jgi:hypothetical protein
MFSWFKKPAIDARWNVAGSERYTFVLFGNDALGSSVAPALATLQADLKKISDEKKASAAGSERKRLDDEDDEGAIAAWIAANVSALPIDVDEARATLPPRAVLSNSGLEPSAAAILDSATDALEIRAPAATVLDRLAPFALLSAVGAIAREANGVALDTIGLRVVSKASLDEPLAGLPDRSAGPHVVIRTTESAGALTFETAGLEKFGIFEIALRDVPAHLSGAVEIVRGTAQILAWERPQDACSWDPGRLFVSPAEAAIFARRERPGNDAYALFRAEPPATGSGWGWDSWTIMPGKGASDEAWLRETLRAMHLPERAA